MSNDNDEQQLARNVAISKAVIELLSFVPDLTGTCWVTGDKVAEARFWEVLATKAAEKIGLKIAAPSPIDKPMTVLEIQEFENTPITFGMHVGKRVGDIETSYWLRLVEDKFNKDLRRYVKTKRFQSKQDDPEDDDEST